MQSLNSQKEPKIDIKVDKGVLQTKDAIGHKEHVVHRTVPERVLALLL